MTGGRRTGLSAGFASAWLSAPLLFGGLYVLVIPLPLWLAEIGHSDWQKAVVVGAFGIGALVLRPLSGGLADRAGHRRIAVAGAVALAWGEDPLLLRPRRWPWPPQITRIPAVPTVSWAAETVRGATIIAILAADPKSASRTVRPDAGPRSATAAVAAVLNAT